MSSWAPTKYKSKNCSSCNDSLKQRGLLSIWFDPEMDWTPPPCGKRGRQQQFSDAAIQTCLTLKILFGILLRQTIGFLQNLLRLAGLDWATPDFGTLCRRQKALKVNLSYRGSTGALNLLLDSMGIKAEGEGEWTAHKHPSHTCKHVLAGSGAVPNAVFGARYTFTARQGHAVHDPERGIDEETLEVRAVEVTSSNIGDAPMLPKLLN